MPGLSSNDLLTKDQDFAIERMYYHKNICMSDTHYHNHYEILYIQSGQRTLTINNALSYRLNAQNIALIKPNMLHHTASVGDPNQTRVLINISTGLMDEIASQFTSGIYSCFNVPVLSLNYYESSMLNYLFAELLDNKQDSPLYEARVRINLSKILLLMSEIYLSSPDDHELQYANQNNNERVDFVINYFHKYFNNNISMEKLASELFCTETYLSRIFKKNTGTTPYKYLQNIRIINAQKLLRSRRMSVSNIALSCGFNSLMAFSRAFKQIQGCSPKEYQKSFINSSMDS